MPRSNTIDPTNASIGQTLREVRETAGLSQATAAARLEIAQAAISQWESGKRCPSVRDLPRIADVYGLHPWILARKIFQKISKS